MDFRTFAYKNVSRNIKAYFAYFLSTCISSALFFSFTMFLFHPNKGQFKSYIGKAILVTEIIAYLFLFFFVFYSVSVFLKTRYKEFGVLYIIGISKKQLYNMIFIENIIINAIATLSGIIIGLVFSKIYLVVIERLLRLNSLSFYFPIKAIVITFASFVLLGVFVSFFTSSIIREKEVLKLLKATKAPKTEPKTSIFLAVLGFSMLILGYYITLTASKQNLDKIILPVVAMVIFATYLLFSHLSVFSIRLLKKNRRLYLKKTNLLLISNLFYKIKDNSRMFFLIAITSTVAFTFIGTSFAFWKNTLGDIEKRYPYDFTYTTFGESAKLKEELNFLEAILREENYTYKKVKIENTYTFQVKDWSDTYKVYDKYAEKYGDDQFSLLLSKSHIYETEKRAYGTIMFLSIFIGILFFVTSGSFIYNKFYMDEEVDKQKYLQLNKIGLTYNEIKKVITLEIGVLFLFPYIVAVIHSSLALTVLKNVFNVNVTGAAFLVMGSFLLVQILFFLFIREGYLSEMRDRLID
ncbi:ABC transporter permease [Clostridium sp. CS001]|uniref:ABC transporter permease n=1 Tax=Clostridium sp. CS001 TaxID=2880648 RepID=UPI001CF48852|nr:ABC transporter permease [Clostridium sp. CS001]MCB2288429.1 ABC transporter permease [Clostridium sp. CS001]